MKPNEYEFNFSNEITTRVVLDGLNELKDSDFSFVDVELLTNCNISYSKLPLVDFVLISALLVLVKSIKTQSLSLVDVYKSAGEDYALIDKFYAMYNNELLISLINLNYYYLSTAVDKTKEKLLDILSVTYQYNQQEIDDIVERIKQYSKQDKGILGYLYLYNIFSV